jgi:ATP-binding cassette subfamily A (ABC1) protein 3
MAASFQTPQWRRITRQTITLTKKNFLLYRKAWITTILRAVVFPIAVTLVFCLLRNIGEQTYYGSDTPNYGIAPTTYPVPALWDALNSSPSRRLVFVRNGVSGNDIDRVVVGINRALPGPIDTHEIDDPDGLFDLCQQSLAGHSDCFAAIIFQSSNETTIEYTIAVDFGHLDTSSRYGNWNTGKTKISERIMPLQWAVNSHLGGFSTVPRPSTRPRGGEPPRNYYSDYNSGGNGSGKYWYDELNMSHREAL